MCTKLNNKTMMKWLILIALIAMTNFSSSLGMKACDRTPEGTGSSPSPPDGRFKLKIINEPIRYIPGETYKISLEGVSRYNSPSPQKFVGFFLTVEGEKVPFSRNEEDDLGSFSIVYPALSKISEKCQNLVVNTNSVPKSEVLIEWTAPASGRGCITFKSTIIEHRDVWFMDEGALSKTLCEDEADSVDLDAVIQECKACNEAKYELTFEGLWSRNTHPKDFPDDGWRTKFSDIVGASHSIGSHFWHYGDTSSDGMKDVAEFGATSKLETELKEMGEKIRTIIKARGISYPNVNGKTFAVFRVDAEHHLVSLVSKLYPSPDWFVGVSDLELCQGNGQWVENKVINLYPYDAGTDSGATYISSDQPTRPQESIRRIKPNNPNDPRSPFYDIENKEMKPLARLYITRQRLYEKNCDKNDEIENDEEQNDKEEDNDQNDNQEEVDTTDYCETNPYVPYGACSNSCGPGTQTLRRTYKHSTMSINKGCSKQMSKTVDCKGTDGCSRSNNNNVRYNNDANDDDREEDENGSQENKNNDENADEDDAMRNKECHLTDWSNDSCSCESGQPKKRLHREFKLSKNTNKCKRRHPKILFEKEEDCPRSECAADGESTARPKIGINCPDSKLHDWSPFSPCTSDDGVGMGIMIQVRKPKPRNLNSDENIQRFVNMYEKLKKYKDTGIFEKNENDDDVTTLNVTTTANPDHVCYGVQFVRSELCGKPNDDYDNDPNHFCLLPPIIKKCQDTPEPRYYYSHQKKRCGMFLGFGCPGIKNDFETFEECETTCGGIDFSEDTKSEPLISRNLVQERIDCQMTQWEYTPCNSTCGQGYRWKFRSVVIDPQNGGKPCPKNVRKLEKCRATDCELVPKAHHQRFYPPARVMTTTKNPTPQCLYSEWSAWSPCSKSCGHSAVKIRTRALMNVENSAICVDRLEQRKCSLMPCLTQNYNYRQHNAYNLD